MEWDGYDFYFSTLILNKCGTMRQIMFYNALVWEVKEKEKKKKEKKKKKKYS